MIVTMWISQVGPCGLRFVGTAQLDAALTGLNKKQMIAGQYYLALMTFSDDQTQPCKDDEPRRFKVVA